LEKVWLKSYESSVPHEISELKYTSLSEYVQHCCDQFSDRVAFTNIGTDLTYQQLDTYTTAFANYLRHELKLKKNDRIAIMMPNLLQYPIALFGALKAGLVVVNVNPLYTAEELKFQLQDAGVETLVVLANFVDTVAEVVEAYPLKHIIVTQLGDCLGGLKGPLINFALKYVKRMVPRNTLKQWISFKTVLSHGQRLRNVTMPSIFLTDIAFLQYTGGTTGVSKAAILSHENILANIQQSSLWIKSSSQPGNELLITPLPLYHIFSLTVNCLIFLGLGSQNVLITNPRDTHRFVKILRKYTFTAITAVNTLFNTLSDHPDFPKVNFSRLKVALGGGMSVQRAVAEKWERITKKPLLEAYGLTETSPGAIINPMYITTYNGTVGLPLPSTDIKVCDPSGNELGFNEPGELYIRGPQVMQGYWNRPDETAKVLVDGWLRTGDIAEIDEKGFVSIVDRIKDMILVSGFNVYPNQVEDVLVKCPGVIEAGVIGEKQDDAREVVVAYIVRSDQSLSEESIERFAREHLTAYKIPKKIVFIEELPKTNVGKISRKDLKTIHAAKA
jgi:long-chain acyl-CoA synthetase